MSSCKFLIFYLDLKCNWVKHFTGEGVQVAVSSFKKDAEVNEVDYCGYVELRRPMFMKDHTFAAGEFDLLTTSGQTGVSYFLPRPLGSDTNQTLPWSSIYSWFSLQVCELYTWVVSVSRFIIRWIKKKTC